MITKLKDIATIQMGFSFRERLESISTGAIAVIQMKDLTIHNHVDCSGLLRIDIDNFKEQHLVSQGDLIFRSRGQVTTSAILKDEPGRAVVAAPLIRIRVTNNSVLPEYLNWFINQVPAQAYLASYAEGTSQRMISKQTIENLEIYVPPIELQGKIIELSRLAEEEQLLIAKIADRRKKYIASSLIKLAKGE